MQYIRYICIYIYTYTCAFRKEEQIYKNKSYRKASVDNFGFRLFSLHIDR